MNTPVAERLSRNINVASLQNVSNEQPVVGPARLLNGNKADIAVADFSLYERSTQPPKRVSIGSADLGHGAFPRQNLLLGESDRLRLVSKRPRRGIPIV